MATERFTSSYPTPPTKVDAIPYYSSYPKVKPNPEYTVANCYSFTSNTETFEFGFKWLNEVFSSVEVESKGEIDFAKLDALANLDWEMFRERIAILKGCYQKQIQDAIYGASAKYNEILKIDAVVCIYHDLKYKGSALTPGVIEVSDQATLDALWIIASLLSNPNFASENLPLQEVVFTKNEKCESPGYSKNVAKPLVATLPHITTLTIKNGKKLLDSIEISNILGGFTEAVAEAKTNSALRSLRMEQMQCSPDQITQMLRLLPADEKTVPKAVIEYNARTRFCTMDAGSQQTESSLIVSEATYNPTQITQMLHLLPADEKTVQKAVIECNARTYSLTINVGSQQTESGLIVSETECKNTDEILALLGAATPKQLTFRKNALSTFKDPNITDLTIAVQAIKDTDCVPGGLFHQALQTPQLTKLRIERPRFLPEDSAREKCLTTIFTSKPSLHSLSLINFNLGESHRTKVARYLENNSNLVELDLTGNPSLCTEAFWAQLAHILLSKPKHSLSSISPVPTNQQLVAILQKNQQRPKLEPVYEEAQKILAALTAQLAETTHRADTAETKFTSESAPRPIQQLIADWRQGYEKILSCAQFSIPSATVALTTLKQYYALLPKLMADAQKIPRHSDYDPNQREIALPIQEMLLAVAPLPEELKKEAMQALIAELEKIPSIKVSEGLVEFVNVQKNVEPYYEAVYESYFKKLSHELSSSLTSETKKSMRRHFTKIIQFLSNIGERGFPPASQANIQLAWSIILKIVPMQASELSSDCSQRPVETKAERKSVSSANAAQNPSDVALSNFKDLSTPFCLLPSNNKLVTLLTVKDAQIINDIFLDLCKATCKRLMTTLPQAHENEKLRFLLKNIEVIQDLKGFAVCINGFELGWLDPSFLKSIKGHLKEVANQANLVGVALMKVIRPAASNPAGMSSYHIAAGAFNSPAQPLQDDLSAITNLLQQLHRVTASSPDPSAAARYQELKVDIKAILTAQLAMEEGEAMKMNTTSNSAAAIPPTTSASRITPGPSAAALLATGVGGGSPLVIGQGSTNKETSSTPSASNMVSYPDITPA